MSYRERTAKRRGTVLLGAAAAGALVAAIPGCGSGNDPCASLRLPDGGLRLYFPNGTLYVPEACLNYLADGGK